MNQSMAIYEIDPGSWMRVPEDNHRVLTCAEMAPKLVEYVQRMNFTHVEFLSLAAIATHGENEIIRLVEHLHQKNIGVIVADISEENARILQADGWRNGNVLSLFSSGEIVQRRWDTDRPRDLLQYFRQDPAYRKFHHHLLTARGPDEKSIWSLGRELVELGKGSLLQQMAGDEWQKFANLRLLFTTMTGSKSIFMGHEFGQVITWRPETSLDWHLLQFDSLHAKLQRWVSDHNRFCLRESAMSGLHEWINASDTEWSTLSWLRQDQATRESVLAICNFTPVPRHNYRVGAPAGGFWREVLNSDATEYGGSGQGNLGGVEASPFGWHFKSHSLTVTLPPLGAVFFKHTS